MKCIWDYSVVVRRSSSMSGDTIGIHLKGNRFFGDKKVWIWENLLDYMPQNLPSMLSLVYSYIHKLQTKEGVSY